MKSIIIIGAILLISINAFCQIDFRDLKTLDKDGFESVLKEAESQEKLVFIYFSASWCGPCKSFEKTIMSDNNVIDFYKNNFINIKVNWDREEPFHNK
ncbi:MAG: DUF255 domain-containing protein, partial [Bacteroidales bacterium]|nr:DUF255 domain-containing protein [Bacteroidales bacterium]